MAAEEYARKKITNVANEYFNDENIIYMQELINHLHQKETFTLLFFDEVSLKKPTTSLTWASPKRKKLCRDLIYHQDPNIMLNLLVRLTGVKYANVIDGPSNTLGF